MMNIGVIGVGKMGNPIARRLIASGYTVGAFDKRSELKASTVAAGASWHESPADLAAASDALLISVPGPAEVDSVMHGSSGVLTGRRKDLIVVQTSTIGPAQTREIAAECTAHEILFLDAPISGGVEGAEKGTLAVMVGGDAQVFDRARALLEAFGKRIFHVGPAGSGSAMKLVIQSIFLSQLAAFLESVSLGEGAGIPVDVMVSVIAESSAHHPAVGKRYAKLIENDLAPRLAVTAALKDLRLAMELWEGLGLDARVVAAATRAFEQTAQIGFKDKDVISLREIYRGRTQSRAQ